MSEGELPQIQKNTPVGDMDEATYFQIIADKTAHHFTCCEIGAVESASVRSNMPSRLENMVKSLQSFRFVMIRLTVQGR